MTALGRPLRVLGFRLAAGRPDPAVGPTDLWVHGASLGEVAAAASLIDRLPDPAPTVHLTSGTPEGLRRADREGWARTRGPGPLGRRGARALLEALQPRALWLVESELWPGLLGAARDAGVGVGVVGARVSDRSYRRMRSAPGRSWFRALGRAVRRFAAADRRSAERLIELGVPAERVRLTGRIKLPRAPRRDAPIAILLEQLAPGRPWIIGGCTHAGEERALLATGVHPLLLAPRHLRRLAAVERVIRRAGRRPVRRTASPRRLADDEVLVLDTVGELADAYGSARWSLVGGSVAGPRAHDLLEPLRGGSRLLVGPLLEHQRDDAEALRAAGALVDFDGVVPAGDAGPLDAAALVRALDGRDATVDWMRAGGLL